MPTDIKEILDAYVDQYNRPSFIADDPISIPHQFTKKQDIEIMGFWAATLAWSTSPAWPTEPAKLHSLAKPV